MWTVVFSWHANVLLRWISGSRGPRRFGGDPGPWTESLQQKSRCHKIQGLGFWRSLQTSGSKEFRYTHSHIYTNGTKKLKYDISTTTGSISLRFHSHNNHGLYFRYHTKIHNADVDFRLTTQIPNNHVNRAPLCSQPSKLVQNPRQHLRLSVWFRKYDS